MKLKDKEIIDYINKNNITPVLIIGFIEKKISEKKYEQEFLPILTTFLKINEQARKMTIKLLNETSKILSSYEN